MMAAARTVPRVIVNYDFESAWLSLTDSVLKETFQDSSTTRVRKATSPMSSGLPYLKFSLKKAFSIFRSVDLSMSDLLIEEFHEDDVWSYGESLK